VLSKLEYLAVCRSFQLLMLHARGDVAKDLEILVLPRSRWSCLFVRPKTLLPWHQRLIAGA
jgi:hypothetical protein